MVFGSVRPTPICRRFAFSPPPPSGARHRSYIELDDDEARIVLADGRFIPARGQDRHPVTEVTWYGARAYCLWRGGDLPTETQWEAAARGTDDRLYPWGDATHTSERTVTGGKVGDTVAVGLRPSGASPFGALDMAGSLAEWTRSLSGPTLTAPTMGANPLTRRASAPRAAATTSTTASRSTSRSAFATGSPTILCMVTATWVSAASREFHEPQPIVLVKCDRFNWVAGVYLFDYRQAKFP